MLINVENAITKEKMDKMGEYDFNSMRKSLITLEEQISILSGTTTEIETMQKDIQKLYEETETLKNKPKGGDDIKLATIQMLNNVEFENIYSILNSGNLAAGQSGGENINYSEMMENKINKVLEKIKDDNEKMWINVVQMKDKVTDPEEIKKILNQVHPAIVNSSDASKIIDEVEPYEDQTYMPKVNGFDTIKKNNNENNYYNNYNYNNQQDPGPDINSKKSSKKSGSKKSNNTKTNGAENSKVNNINNTNEEKISKVSKKSKTSKVGEEKKAEESKSLASKKSKVEETKNQEENKSNKSQKQNTPVEQSQVKPTEESKDIKKTTNENEEGDEEDDEDDDEEENEGSKKGKNEELQGKLKKNEEISGKSLTGIKK